MSFSVGIGIITYNRADLVSNTIDRVRALTREPDAVLVVADDGSSDGTLAMLRGKQVPGITGVNMGIAWNKNRALFLLSQMLGCETVILLEDDTEPSRAGWEREWMQAARQWGHVNYAGEWMNELFLSGAGTADDPIRSKFVTAQCAAYSRSALTYGGYFDPHFSGYGHEHVEHTRRLIQLGYGGTEENDGTEQVFYKLIRGNVSAINSVSTLDAVSVETNLQLARDLMTKDHYRAPWLNDKQLRQFRSEIESAMNDGPDQFRLTPRRPQDGTRPRHGRGTFRRFFSRA